MKTMRFATVNMLSLLLGMVLSDFSVSSQEPHMITPVKEAICVLTPTQGNTATGSITFSATDGGVKITVHIQGLSKGKHGFHIHECGNCSAPDGSSAGGHFNPMGNTHGAPMDMSRHMGDMGNIEADEAGTVTFEYVDSTIALSGENSIIGRSVIVHKNEDDLKTQPSGNAGPRIACGVIGIVK